MFLKFIIYLPAKATRTKSSEEQPGVLKLIYVKAVRIGFAKRSAEGPFRRESNIIARRL